MDPSARLGVTREARATLKKLSKALQRDFKTVIERYWTNVVKNIDFRKSDNFFLKNNAIFRPKQFTGIDNIHIKADNNTILTRSGCNFTNNTKIGDEYIFSNRSDKLNIIGAYYESINSSRFLNDISRFKQIVGSGTESLKLEFNTYREQNVTLIRVRTDNPTSNPVLGWRSAALL